MRVSKAPSIYDGPNQWFDPVDPRHVGKVLQVDLQGIATIRWHETGMLSVVPMTSLQRLATTRWVPGLGHQPIVNH